MRTILKLMRKYKNEIPNDVFLLFENIVRTYQGDEYNDMPLTDKLELFNNTFGKTAVLNEDNTITVTFACNHGYYKHAPKGKFQFPASIETYFERCAGGRLYELQKALGVKLKIKSVDVSPLSENILNPVVFTFEMK